VRRRQTRVISWRLSGPVPKQLLAPEGNLAIYATALHQRGFKSAKVVIAPDGAVLSVELFPTRESRRHQFASLEEAFAAFAPAKQQPAPPRTTPN
jgi:hypothetical protein